jgi:hypothetical protein
LEKNRKSKKTVGFCYFRVKGISQVTYHHFDLN